MITPAKPWELLLAGALGGLAAAITGREKTRYANFAIGALFAASAAWYDKPGGTGVTLAVAAVEGVIWGATDRYIPMLKQAVLHPTEPAKA